MLAGVEVEVIVKARVLLTVWLATSVTCAVRLKVPATVGFPFSTPLDRESPAGRPEGTDHVYGGTPPAAVNVWLEGALSFIS